MRTPIDLHAMRMAARVAVSRYFAIIRITNLSELTSAYSVDARSIVDRHVKHRLASVWRHVPGIFFQDGPCLLVDLPACMAGSIRNEDVLCEQLNALVMEEPVMCGTTSVYLKVETTLIECPDSEWRLLRDGGISRLANHLFDTLKLKEKNGKEKAFRADMALTVSLFSQLANGELVLAFQPIRSAHDRNVVIYWESLLRRRVNQSPPGLTTCADYIAAAERAGLASRLDRSVLWAHIALLKAHPDVKLGCNISAQSLKFDAWWRVLFDALSGQPDAASRLTIEITETSPVTADDEAMLLLRTLRLLGCKIAIDDMGAGYSTLSFALRAKPDFIKINETGLALSDEPISLRRDRVVKQLIKLCSHLGSCVIVEAVESEDDATTVADWGAHGLQGYVLGRPGVSPPWLSAPAIVCDAFASGHESHGSSPLFAHMVRASAASANREDREESRSPRA
ncbi:EAL domain-containing protein [Paracandidimonas soli]|uniref:EAL domain-containing protein (Putative c-di-GMP-specific phosphodiesterase class I) n=1 Tax=Paracandidimonas soli TaxID=1917182 RepID=A0A4R3VCQ3_9BURK|nr:EAL domain-containing protein [Paracandidimonas soli]TCV01398.1 EAL domain-containing protein (putative c-di-GMP-specific phosphodiesterase class I) [Paracandidimonas soli]